MFSHLHCERSCFSLTPGHDAIADQRLFEAQRDLSPLNREQQQQQNQADDRAEDLQTQIIIIFIFPRMRSVKAVRLRPAQMMKEKIIEIIFPVL